MIADTPKRTRDVPRPRKIFGTSHNIDGEVMVYTEAEMMEFGDRCFADGFRACEAKLIEGRRASNERNPIQAEDDAWADYRSGRGPHPTRR